jgi:flagellin
MAYEVNTNVAALNVYNNLGIHQTKAASSLSKISSGLKAAGGVDIASQGAAATINANYQANQTEVSGVQDAINQLRVADQVYNEWIALAQKGLEVASRAADANADTTATQAQLTKIQAALESLATNAQFNGASWKAAAVVDIGGGNLTVTPGFIVSDDGAVPDAALELDMTDLNNSREIVNATAVADLNAYIAGAIDLRAENAAQLAALQSVIQVLNSSATNMLAGMGQAQDTDIAKEMMTLTSANIMTEAATAMLAQAMQLPNSVLRLLQ